MCHAMKDKSFALGENSVCCSREIPGIEKIHCDICSRSWALTFQCNVSTGCPSKNDRVLNSNNYQNIWPWKLFLMSLESCDM